MMQKTLDIIGILMISGIPIASPLMAGRIDQTYEQIIMILICTAYSFLFVNKLKIYFFRIGIAIVLSCILTTVFFGAAYGYLLLFYLVIFKLVMIGAIAGYIIAGVIDIALQKLSLADKTKNTIVVGLILLSTILMAWKVSTDVSENNFLESAVTNRDELINRVIAVITKDNKNNFNNKNIIDLGYLDDLYSHDGKNKITHEYSGDVEINANGDELIITYKEIPAGISCYWFYFMNSPEHFGFSTITVDGISTRTDTNSYYDDEQKKNDLCYSGKTKVEINYRAKIDRIIEVANW